MWNWLFSIVGKLLWWLIRQLARLIAWLCLQAGLHWRSTAAVGVAATSATYLGWKLCAVILGGTLASLSTWKAAHSSSFEATVGTWARSWWHRWWIYRRNWSMVMDRCQLSMQVKTEVLRPKLRKVTSTPYWDHLVVELQIGQAQKHVQAQVDELAMAFRSERIVVSKLPPRRVEIALMRRDPLLRPVPAALVPASVDAVNFRSVPVGIDEFGRPYTVSLLGGHTVVAGSTGAGKASLEWNILRSVAPAIAAGLVRPVFIDPKRKELVQGRDIVAAGDYVGADTENLPEATLAILERLVGEMEAANAASGAAGERDFAPSTLRPLTLIFIDELAPLLAYWKRSLRDKIEDQLGLLLTQGRAAGYIVIGAIQEPTKDVFPVRDLFNRRLALRLPTESHTDAALIEHATDYGALCHEIPESLPGLVYSLQDGARSTVRARLGHVRDEDIHELLAYIEGSRKVVTLRGREDARLEDVA